MKEATGELNMTVITVVAIAAVGALFTFFIWPNIQSNLALTSACSSTNANGNYKTEDGNIAENEDGYVICEDHNCTAYYNGRKYKRNCIDTNG